jgi:hypothetical protein
MSYTCAKCNGSGEGILWTSGREACTLCSGTGKTRWLHYLDRGFPHCWMPTGDDYEAWLDVQPKYPLKAFKDFSSHPGPTFVSQPNDLLTTTSTSDNVSPKKNLKKILRRQKSRKRKKIQRSKP